jgi:hypothetical protein
MLFLLLVTLIQANDNSNSFMQLLKTRPSQDVLVVPTEVRFVEETSLPPHAPVTRQPDGRELGDPERLNPRAPLGDLAAYHQRTGQRLLAFLLQPGERLSVKQEGPAPQRIRLSLLSPREPGPMTEEIGRANRKRAPEAPVLALEVRNVTAAPFQVVLMVQGPEGVPYRLGFHRQAP